MLPKLVLCYILKSIIKIHSVLKYFLLKYNMTFKFDNLLMLHSYSVQVSIYLIIHRKFFHEPRAVPESNMFSTLVNKRKL
jgi:hypothetical protein